MTTEQMKGLKWVQQERALGTNQNTGDRRPFFLFFFLKKGEIDYLALTLQISHFASMGFIRTL